MGWTGVRWAGWVVFASLVSGLAGAGGQEAPTTTLSVQVKVVTLPVTVRDKHGKIVRDLTKDDFELKEDGRPENIRYFNLDSNLPLTLGLLVDTSMSERDEIDKERVASKSFIEQMLTTPKDKAFLIHFDREVELLQDLTDSKPKLEAALELLQVRPRMERADSSGGSGSGGGDGSGSDSGSGDRDRHMHGGGGTALYDAVFLAADEVTKKQTGRKALIVLSDGEDRGSKESLENAIEAAQRADTIVYAIYFAGKNDQGGGFQRNGGYGGRRGGGFPGGGGWPGSGGGRPGGGGGQRPQEHHVDGKKILTRMAEETGGRMFEVSKKQSVDQIYAEIGDELRTQYTLGYTPDKQAGAGYHTLALTTKKKDLTVQTRAGYYSDR